ncbi:hypothetical protein R3P38DRAFT_3375283 [Favolaschia claudopus]|uniref:Uncharacterized protein n=1 Tax=Favolaschia claudopus TaxID=2862362 RepID=A0AAV9ZIE1_9AGAR
MKTKGKYPADTRQHPPSMRRMLLRSPAMSALTAMTNGLVFATQLAEQCQSGRTHTWKGRRQRRGLQEEIGVLVNEAADEYDAKESEIADLSNRIVPAKSRRRRRRLHRADDADESVEGPGALEERVRKAGRHMQVNVAVWFQDEAAVFMDDADDDFDYDTEFDSKATRTQAQIQDVIQLLPKEAVPLRTQEWIGSAFIDGMGNQRSATVYRLRHPSLIHLSDKNDLKYFSSSSSRFEHFKERIGYIAATETEDAYYSTFLAPILYDQFHDDLDVNHLFRNPLPLQLCAGQEKTAGGI